jgi:hypothetical protein
MNYTVEVTREGDNWLATILGLEGAHTYAGNLKALDEAVVEAIQLVTDLPDDAPVEFHYTFIDVDELVLKASAAGERRQQLEEQQARMQTEMAEWIAQLTNAGYSVRDTAGLLHMSPGRVSQITKSFAHDSEFDGIVSSLADQPAPQLSKSTGARSATAGTFATKSHANARRSTAIVEKNGEKKNSAGSAAGSTATSD